MDAFTVACDVGGPLELPWSCLNKQVGFLQAETNSLVVTVRPLRMCLFQGKEFHLQMTQKGNLLAHIVLRIK